MITNQKLKKSLEEIKNITSFDAILYSAKGKHLTGTVDEPEHSDIFVKEFIVSEEDVKEKNGAIAEQFIFQELSSKIPYLYYWVSGATARVPFVYEGENAPVPVDIRFVPNTKAQNIKTFRSKNPNTDIVVKVSFNQVCLDGDTLNIPAYGLWNM